MTPELAQLNRATSTPATRKRAGDELRPIPPQTVVLLRCLTEDDDTDYVQGFVVDSDEAGCRVRLDARVPLNEAPRLELMFLGAAGDTQRVEAVLNAVRGDEASRILDLRITGVVKRDEQRQAYRVCVAGLGMTMQIGGAGPAWVVNASADGVGVLSDVPVQRNERRAVKIEFGEQLVSGTMIVRNCTQRADGRHRIGLEAGSEQVDLRKRLQSLTMAVQREQIRRLSAAGTGEEIASGARPQFAVVPPADDAADEVHVVDDGPMHGLKERRSHTRIPWKSELTLEVADGSSTRNVRATTTDVSCGGFGFTSRAYLHVGTVVRTAIVIRNQRRPIAGVVKSCQAIGGFMHRVNVAFIREDAQPN